MRRRERWTLAIAAACALIGVAPAGAAEITTVAGGGSAQPSDGIPATDAQLTGVGAVAPTADGGFLLTTDVNDMDAVWKVSAGGQLTRIAGGNQTNGFGGDGGPALQGRFNEIYALLPEADGGFLIADTNNSRIRRITAAGALSTFATAQGFGPVALHHWPGGGYVAANANDNRLPFVTAGGTVGLTPLGLTPTWDLSVAANGDLLTATRGQNVVERVSGFDPATGAGTVTRAAGGGNGGDGDAATDAELGATMSVAATPGGGFVIGENTGLSSSRIRYVSPSGIISTIAESGAAPLKLMPGAAGLYIAESSRVGLLDKTKITAGPNAFTDETTASIAFDSYYPGPAFECSVDQGQWTSCVSPLQLSGLSEGPHAVSVRGVDTDGVDPTPATRSWTVDTGGPNTYITQKPAAASSSAEATFAFTSPQEGATFQCALDSETFVPCSAPITYENLSSVSHTFKVRAIDGGGAVDPSPATHVWTVDLVQPETTLQTGPAPQTTERDAAFTFTSSEAGTFECKLDTGFYESCTSPMTYADLPVGLHTFTVRAKDAAGNTDSSPATRTWTIDRGPPQTAVTAGPSPLTPSRSATLEFSASELGSTFKCKLDDQPEAGCTSPKGYMGLTDGEHVFTVAAADAAGNQDATPATRSWTVDGTPPEPFALLGPAAGELDVNPKPALRWAPATDATTRVTQYNVFLDGVEHKVAGESCAAECRFEVPQPLAAGAHTWRVLAGDAAGNTRETAPRTFSVDATPPGEFQPTAPEHAVRLNSKTVRLSWAAAADERPVTYRVDLDGKGEATSATELTVGDLADGAHRWKVVARDPSGNERASAERSFVVDTTVPAAEVTAAPNPALIDFAVTFDASGSKDPDGGRIVRYEWDLDGDGTFELDGGASPTTSRAFPAAGQQTARVRVTDEVGLSKTAETSVRISARPTAQSGPGGMVINNNARYTRTREVTLNLSIPVLATAVVVSNGGDPNRGTNLPLKAELPWTLEAIESEGKETRTVSVWFVTGSSYGPQISDPITLDEDLPAITTAKLEAGRDPDLRLRAKDQTSGVRDVQLKIDGRTKAAVPYRTVVALPGKRAPRRLLVRVSDKAGNRSVWKRVRVAR